MLVSDTTGDAEAEPCERRSLSQRISRDTTQSSVRGTNTWTGGRIHVSQPTFGSFDEFDLNDGLQHGSAAPHVQSDDGTGNLQGFHCLAVGNFGHV